MASKNVLINCHSTLEHFFSIFCIFYAFLLPQIDLLQFEQIQILTKIESKYSMPWVRCAFSYAFVCIMANFLTLKVKVIWKVKVQTPMTSSLTVVSLRVLDTLILWLPWK